MATRQRTRKKTKRLKEQKLYTRRILKKNIKNKNVILRQVGVCFRSRNNINVRHLHRTASERMPNKSELTRSNRPLPGIVKFDITNVTILSTKD